MSTRISDQFEALICEAVDQHADELFLIPGEVPSIRMCGMMIKRIGKQVLSESEVFHFAEEIADTEELARVGKENGGISRSLYLPGITNVRVEIARAFGEITLTIGLCSLILPSVEKIAIPQAMLDAALSRSGLVIFSGPVGSGKTTSLYSVADYINEQKACLICTVEEPILMRLTPKQSLIQQREVGVDAPNFLAGIQASENQGMNVLLLNEIRSLDVLQACLGASERGCLVLMQLYSPNSPEDALQRMVEVFAEESRGLVRKALARQLRGVCSQRLLPKVAGGRAAVYGVLIPDEEMRRAIEEGRPIMGREKPLPDGCQTLREHLEQLRCKGVISNETAEQALAEM